MIYFTLKRKNFESQRPMSPIDKPVLKKLGEVTLIFTHPVQCWHNCLAWVSLIDREKISPMSVEHYFELVKPR